MATCWFAPNYLKLIFSSISYNHLRSSLQMTNTLDAGSLAKKCARLKINWTSKKLKCHYRPTHPSIPIPPITLPPADSPTTPRKFPYHPIHNSPQLREQTKYQTTHSPNLFTRSPIAYRCPTSHGAPPQRPPPSPAEEKIPFAGFDEKTRPRNSPVFPYCTLILYPRPSLSLSLVSSANIIIGLTMSRR